MHVAVLGHVERVDFLKVAPYPRPGDIVHAESWWVEAAAGGGSVAAVWLRALAGTTLFFTALGADPDGAAARAELERRGVTVHAAVRDEPTRRAVTLVEPSGERTIVVAGNRLDPSGTDPLAWGAFADADAAYLCAGDARAIRAARNARVVVATSRILPALREAGVAVDALVGSARDPAERFDDDLVPSPALVVRTAGARGGWYRVSGEEERSYEAIAPPGPAVDTYGCGDAFAAGLTFSLGRGDAADEAIRFAATCGARALAGRGPYGGVPRD